MFCARHVRCFGLVSAKPKYITQVKTRTYEGIGMFETLDDNCWDQADKMALTAFELYENGKIDQALTQLAQTAIGISTWH